MNMIKFAAFISWLTNLTGNRFLDCSCQDIETQIKNLIEHEQLKVNLVPMFDAMLTNRKIDAFKEYRTLTGFGLKESKDEIERLMARMSQAPFQG